MTSQSNPKQPSFGHDRLCKHLVKRINQQFDEPKRTIEPSLVIGLFGEWGSGKSHLLNLVDKHYQDYRIKEDQLTLPIAFNPWRFEKEEHLIIPLLKTIELALQDCEAWLKENQTQEAEAAEWAAGKLAVARKFIGVSALAFVSSLKTKLSIPGLSEAEIDGSKLVEAYQKYYPDHKESQENFSDLTSHYFNFQQKLKSVTGRSGQANQPKLNLLFLIDDLDRCLPEKAVEMLEAVKLFLDVEGCAFVLAVDDEVIERGIVHRYRDYIFQQQSHTDNGLSASTLNAAPPITGSEYLEKIIHLPFRLPVPTEKEIRAFLLQEFTDLFAPQKEATQHELSGDLQPQKQAKQDTALLDLFVRAVPHVPRKLIRAVELFQLQRDIIKERGMQSLHELTLARLVILQLLVPEIFRFGRKWQGFLATLEHWEKEHQGRWILPSMELEKPKDNKDLFLHEWQEQPLLALIKQHNSQRSGFNIRNIIDTEQPCDKGLSRYFCLLDDSQIEKSSTAIPLDNRPIMQLVDEAAFIELMTSERPDGWSSAAGMLGINSGVMGEELFNQFKQSIGDSLDALIQPEWLKIVAPLLTQAQQYELWQDLPTNLIEKLQQKETKPEKRLWVGDCLNALGDPRKGVGVNDNGLPDIDWVDIPKGDFLYGENKETQYLDDFKISRYPVTNRQFQCFLDAGGAEDKQWWQGLEQPSLQSARWSQDNRPITDVDWYQAIAFTRWLSAQTNLEIRLPTEQEWEKAARGTKGREYPWGEDYINGYANCNEEEQGSSLLQTSPVGVYPQGDSPYKVQDMEGNVLEWCLNKYKQPDVIAIDKSNEYRVFRGGSFLDSTNYLRCAIRFRFFPTDRVNNLGFRVCCVSS